MVKLLIALFLTLIPLNLPAQDTTKTRLLIASGVCLISDPELAMPDGTPTLAAAYTKGKVPCSAIIVNPILAQHTPESVMLFAIMHEIGHLALSHKSPEDTTQIFRLEQEADCFGVQRLKQYWPMLVDDFLSRIKDYFIDSETHGESNVRYNHLVECLK